MSDYCEVPLSKGLIAHVSPKDFDRVSRHKWHASQGARKDIFYARAWIRGKGSDVQNKHVLLHVFITGDTWHDHIDNNPLNCVRENLRKFNKMGQNFANTPARNKTGFKGVYSYPQLKGKYVARIGKPNNGGQFCIGTFIDPVEAAKAVDKKAKEFWGEFARLNFPEG